MYFLKTERVQRKIAVDMFLDAGITTQKLHYDCEELLEYCRNQLFQKSLCTPALLPYRSRNCLS